MSFTEISLRHSRNITQNNSIHTHFASIDIDGDRGLSQEEISIWLEKWQGDPIPTTCDHVVLRILLKVLSKSNSDLWSSNATSASNASRREDADDDDDNNDDDNKDDDDKNDAIYSNYLCDGCPLSLIKLGRVLKRFSSEELTGQKEEVSFNKPRIAEGSDACYPPRSSEEAGKDIWKGAEVPEELRVRCDIAVEPASLSPEEFRTKYLLTGTPVLIRGVSENWTAMEKWASTESLEET